MSPVPEGEESKESAAEEASLHHSSLARMLSLSAALGGGGIFLLTDWTLGVEFKIAEGLVLTSMLCAMKGVLLRRRADPAASARRLRSWLEASCLLLFLGLLLAFFGILRR